MLFKFHSEKKKNYFHSHQDDGARCPKSFTSGASASVHRFLSFKPVKRQEGQSKVPSSGHQPVLERKKLEE